MTFDDVRRLVFSLPETSEKVSWGHLHWRVKEKGFVWERPLTKTDLAHLGDTAPTGELLGVYAGDQDGRDLLLAQADAGFFTIPHFKGYPAVLVPLGPLDEQRLAEIVEDAWLARAPKRLVREYLADHPPDSD